MLSGAADLIALEEELRSLEQAMAAGDHDQATLARYADAQARLEHAGGYAWRDRTAGVVRGLGFTDADLDRLLDTFSGGELTRASLARALAGDPDLLLLDEPTNHLDVESIEWLERELQSLDAAVILVAHDRWFLEAVTNGVLELSGGRSLYFKGPWHQWRLEKAARAQHAQKALDRLDEDIARLERFVERFRYKKNKAKQAQAKLTHIGRLEEERGGQAQTLDRLTTKKRSMGFDFLKPARSGRTVVEASGLAVKAGDKELLDGVDFALERAEHVALVGPNGSGKTTLLETMLGRRDGAGGKVRLGHGVEAAYFSQQELELDERGTVLDCVQGSTGLPRQSAQNLLGRFLFSGWDEQSKPVTVLSGRGASPAGPRDRRRVRRELPRARRADEPSRPREPRGARGCARGLPRNRPARLATIARCSTPSPSGRWRSRTGPPLVRGRLGGADPPPRGGREGSRAAGAEGHEEAEDGLQRSRPDPTALQVVEADIERQEELRSPTSSASSRTTGATRTFSAGIERRATSSRRCSPGGSACSNRQASSRGLADSQATVPAPRVAFVTARDSPGPALGATPRLARALRPRPSGACRRAGSPCGGA